LPSIALVMNCWKICAGIWPPKTPFSKPGMSVSGVTAAACPTQTAVTSWPLFLAGPVQPMNQALVLFCVVPVFPATGRSPS
jgi:hypothetical protein